MFAKDLIKILQKLPPDTIICKTNGEDGSSVFCSAKYSPQYDILFLEPWWEREHRDYIDMADGDCMFFNRQSRCPYSREELLKIRNLARQGKKIVDDKKDGRMHRIQVTSRAVEKSNPFEADGREFSLLVDNEWVGGLNPVNMKETVCDFEWESFVQ